MRAVQCATSPEMPISKGIEGAVYYVLSVNQRTVTLQLTEMLTKVKAYLNNIAFKNLNNSPKFMELSAFSLFQTDFFLGTFGAFFVEVYRVKSLNDRGEFEWSRKYLLPYIFWAATFLLGSGLLSYVQGISPEMSAFYTGLTSPVFFGVILKDNEKSRREIVDLEKEKDKLESTICQLVERVKELEEPKARRNYLPFWKRSRRSGKPVFKRSEHESKYIDMTDEDDLAKIVDENGEYIIIQSPSAKKRRPRLGADGIPDFSIESVAAIFSLLLIGALLIANLEIVFGFMERLLFDSEMPILTRILLMSVMSVAFISIISLVIRLARISRYDLLKTKSFQSFIDGIF